MAFVCSLSEDSLSANVLIEDSRSLAIIPIGFDDADDKSYSLFVALGPQAGGDLELTFCVVEYDAEFDSEYTHWDSAALARIISSGDRARIRAALLRAIRHLLDAVKPEKVFMCTMGKIASPKAEQKYVLIARTFEICGYAVHCADEFHGQRAWWMERKIDVERNC